LFHARREFRDHRFVPADDLFQRHRVRREFRDHRFVPDSDHHDHGLLILV
jgi:hypothetical protein